MRQTIYIILLAAMALAAFIEVRNDLGYPIPNATVCAAGRCAATNATGVAEVPTGSQVEIYLGNLLVWKTYATGHDVATVKYIDTLDIGPLPASGVLVVKMAKLANGTYTDLEIPFTNNTLALSIPVGNINYQLEIYITKVEKYILEKPLHVKTTIWQPQVDLVKLGLVKTCIFRARPPVTEVAIYSGRTPVAAGAEEVVTYMLPMVNYTGAAATEVRTPTGEPYRYVFNPWSLCNSTIVVNATRLVIRAVDSFGAVRNDWAVVVAGQVYKGQAELWVLPGVPYTVTVDAGFAKKTFTVAASHPSEALIVTVENAYLVITYQQPARRVYIIGNYTTSATMPRRVELPPGTYTVVADMGDRNLTYTVTLAPGQTAQLAIGQPPAAGAVTQTPASGGGGPALYAFLAVAAVMAAAALYIVVKGTPRRRRLARGRSRS
ncbi:hypothetical protein [Pyrobaculum sp.]|uniref:hypothetical protein n=1 Tax=Pyrobaculum sp. TaxID=2004705 RepID=UPI003D0D3E8C